MAIHVTLCAKLVPQMGTPFDVWIPKDARRIFVVGQDGKTCDITSALDGGLFRGLSVALIEELRELRGRVDALVELNERGKDYIKFLKAKVAGEK
jgi:hypothetical protein